MRIKWAILGSVVVCAACSDGGADASLSPDREAVQEAVNRWRVDYDPVWRFAQTHCASGSPWADEVKRRFAQILHRSRANACDRLSAVRETVDVSIGQDVATVTVQAAAARPADLLQFGVVRRAGQWTVRKVDVSSPGTSVTLYDTDQAGDRDPRQEPAYSRWVPHGAADWNITHVITYGQSLSQGFFNAPVLSTHQRYASLRFAGGVRAQDGMSDAQAGDTQGAYARFVPLVETLADQKAETPTAGTLDMAMQLIEQENLQDPATLPYRFLGSAPGEGSMNIGQLSKPGVYYDRLLRDITNGARLARASDRTYGVGAVTWTQGEADDSDGTPIAGVRGKAAHAARRHRPRREGDDRTDVRCRTDRLSGRDSPPFWSACSSHCACAAAGEPRGSAHSPGRADVPLQLRRRRPHG